MTRPRFSGRREDPHWVREDYPSKTWLTESEAMGLLRRGPDLEWFMPWLQETTLRFPGMAERGGFGYAHVSGGSEGPSFQVEIRTFWTLEDLRWGLQTMHGALASPRCDDKCDGLFFWTPETTL